MSKKNRFQKSKSRKYRQPQRVRESVMEPQEAGPRAETRQCLVSTAKSRPREQDRAEKVEPKNFSPLLHSLRDLRLAMYLSLGFVIFLIVLYIIKLETPIFNLAVDYLYKMVRI